MPEFAQRLPQVNGDPPLRRRDADKGGACDSTYRHAYQQLHPRRRTGNEPSRARGDSEYKDPQWQMPEKSTPQVPCTDWAFSANIVVENWKPQQKARERKGHRYADRSKRQTGYKRSDCEHCRY
jgi:hypothetical protein